MLITTHTMRVGSTCGLAPCGTHHGHAVQRSASSASPAAFEVLEHLASTSRENSISPAPIRIQDRLCDQVRFDREDVEAINRVVLEQGLAEGGERARGRLAVRRDLDVASVVRLHLWLTASSESDLKCLSDSSRTSCQLPS